MIITMIILGLIRMQVDRCINQNHLFKRSVILVKAWCYYESRILGAHHALISTYALETLVLYVFHVFHSSLRGPLEVLYTFLEYFSNFDWDKYCVSLWGPVPLSSLPGVAAADGAEPPRKNEGTLLLTKAFLDTCSETYSVVPTTSDNQTRTFNVKFLNVLDPLRESNNLGRSVSKGGSIYKPTCIENMLSWDQFLTSYVQIPHSPYIDFINQSALKSLCFWDQFLTSYVHIALSLYFGLACSLDHSKPFFTQGIRSRYRT
jgi:hypothetical protein